MNDEYKVPQPVKQEVSTEKVAGPQNQTPSEEPNIEMELEYSYPIINATAETIALPSSDYSSTATKINSVEDPSFYKTEENQRWLGQVMAGAEQFVFEDGLSGTTQRKGAMFKQKVEADSGSLMGGVPKFKSKEGVKYTGEAARMRLRSYIGLGTAFTVPLWHSGFWITFKSPTESALLELYRQIASEKVTLGRTTYGLIFSNSSVYVSKALLDFAIDNIYNTTIKLGEDQDIRDFIKIQDLPLIAWGMACAVWPKGFNYQRSCTADPNICTHVISEKIDLKKLLWTDTTALTKQQINHMTNRQPNSMSLESIKIYCDSFVIGVDKKITLSDKVDVILKTPTVNEHLIAGDKWVSSIEETYGRAMMEKGEARDKYLFNQAKATSMRQYTHFVKDIVAEEESNDTPEIIEDILDDMSADDSLRTSFTKQVAEFIDNSVMSVVGVPTYMCPNCGNEQHTNKSKGLFRGLIAIDVTQTFFTLLLQKLQRLEVR
jgi:hypothetical protein